MGYKFKLMNFFINLYFHVVMIHYKVFRVLYVIGFWIEDDFNCKFGFCQILLMPNWVRFFLGCREMVRLPNYLKNFA